MVLKKYVCDFAFKVVRSHIRDIWLLSLDILNYEKGIQNLPCVNSGERVTHEGKQAEHC